MLALAGPRLGSLFFWNSLSPDVLSREPLGKKRLPSSIPIAQFVAIIALSISVFLIVDLGRRAAANYRIQREAERLEQMVEAAQSYQTKLLAQRTYAASDLYVEEIARRELKWSRPGETVVVIMPEYEQAPGTVEQEAGLDEPAFVAKSPPEAWWYLFFGDYRPPNTLP